MKRAFYKLTLQPTSNKPTTPTLIHENLVIELLPRDRKELEETVTDVDQIKKLCFYLACKTPTTSNDNDTLSRLLINLDNVIKSIGKFKFSVLLQNFTNITHLYLISLEKLKPEKLVEINLPSLTHLKMNSGYWLLPTFRNHKIEFLQFKITSLDDHKIFENFLKTCGSLKHLIFEQRMPKINFDNFDFKLHTFEVSQLEELQIGLIKFLNTQKSSLKHLRLDVLNFSHKLAYFAYFEMNLESFYDGRNSHEQIKKLKPIKSLKKLKLRYPTPQSREVKIPKLSPTPEEAELSFRQQIFSCGESLEVLEISLIIFDEDDSFRIIAAGVPKLKHLILRNFMSWKNDDYEHNYEFPSTERLTIYVRYFASFTAKDIGNCFPNLIKLEIFHENYENGSTIEITGDDMKILLEKCENLRGIIIHDLEIPDEVVEVLKNIKYSINLSVITHKVKNYVKAMENLKNSMVRLIVVAKMAKEEDFFALGVEEKEEPYEEDSSSDEYDDGYGYY